MFSDLVGSTELSARMDPEDLREVISVYQKCDLLGHSSHSTNRVFETHPTPGDLSVRFCNLHDRSRSAGGYLLDLPATYDVEEAGAVVLGPDIVEPMPDIASKHE